MNTCHGENVTVSSLKTEQMDYVNSSKLLLA